MDYSDVEIDELEQQFNENNPNKTTLIITWKR
jgi:hypothetical protein